MKTILLCLLFYCCITYSFAQSGILDPSFGTNGIVRTDLGSTFDYHSAGRHVLLGSGGVMYFVFKADDFTLIKRKHTDGSPDLSYGKNGISVSVPIDVRSAVLQTDGKIVVAGRVNGSNYEDNVDIALARYNNDGSLDYSFGTNGIQITDFGSYNYLTSIVIQGDGKIIAASSNQDLDQQISFIAIARYNTNGALDIDFGENGIARVNYTDLYSSNKANAIALQSDGKIVVAGTTLMRFKTNGILDSSFNFEGQQSISGIGNNIIIQKDGKIIVSGKSELSRYTIDGILDSSFGENGIQTTGFGGINETATAMTIQSNGKITLAGYTEKDETINFTIARYMPNGILDSSFSSDGLQITSFDTSNSYINSIAVQNDGNVIAMGFATSGTTSYIAAARYDTNGNLDKSFDLDGVLTDRLNQGSTFFTATAVQNNGKILSVGYTWNGNNNDFGIVRYNNDGSLDNTFSGDGKQITDFGSSDDKAVAIAIQKDGKIIVAGSAADNFAIARYNSDGSLDSSFDDDGMVSTDFGSTEVISAIKIQSDGKILVGGSVLVRYNANGSIDMSFGERGKLTTGFYSNDIVLQNDGKIVIVGDYCTVARYNSYGAVDSTFGDNGERSLYLPTGELTFYGKSLSIANDGKIVVGGYSEYIWRAVESQFTLVRLNSDGTDDIAFNNGQILLTAFNNIDYATSLAVLRDSKIILGGYTQSGTSSNFAIAKYNADGSLDGTFSDNGTLITDASDANDRIAGIAVIDNYLYTVGYGQYPGNLGVVARYLLGAKDTTGCNDKDSAIHGPAKYYRDADDDGYGNSTDSLFACVKPAGYSSNNTDCNDDNPAIHGPVTYYRDADRDGFGDSNSPISVCNTHPPRGYVRNDLDCNDHKRKDWLWNERIKMCKNGMQTCVEVKHVLKWLQRGWTLGPCKVDCSNRLSRNTVVDIDDELRYSKQPSAPLQYKVSNYPNPFAGSSTIRYELPQDSRVLIKVYDALGSVVATLVDEYKKAGTYNVYFNADRLSSGTLYYRIIAKSKDDLFEQTNQMIKIK